MPCKTMENASNKLFERALRVIPGGVNSPVRAFRNVGGNPFFTASANGSRLRTVDGTELIDYVCTWGPAIHGHNDPDIADALKSALSNGTSFGTPGALEVEMAEALVSAIPSLEKVRLCNSGTEATMSAIRVARGFTGRSKVIKFAGCYHGHVDGLLVAAGSGALTLGCPDSAGVPSAYASETIVLPLNDLRQLEAAFSEFPEQIAAVIIEPYPANCGLILPHDGFLETLRQLTRQHGAVLIFDEVMTGFRISFGGVQKSIGIAPDLTALGKIIGGGLPVGAFGGRAELMNCLAPDGPVYQAGTLSGNPLAMAAGLASIRKLEANLNSLYAGLEAAGRHIANALRDASTARGIPLQVPQVGSMFALFFSEDPVCNAEQAAACHSGHFKSVFHSSLENGVYLPPSPFETCFISSAHSQSDIDRTCEVLSNAIRQL